MRQISMNLMPKQHKIKTKWLLMVWKISNSFPSSSLSSHGQTQTHTYTPSSSSSSPLWLVCLSLNAEWSPPPPHQHKHTRNQTPFIDRARLCPGTNAPSPSLYPSIHCLSVLLLFVLLLAHNLSCQVLSITSDRRGDFSLRAPSLKSKHHDGCLPFLVTSFILFVH